MTKEVRDLEILGSGKGVGQDRREGGHSNEKKCDVLCGQAAWVAHWEKGGMRVGQDSQERGRGVRVG